MIDAAHAAPTPRPTRLVSKCDGCLEGVSSPRIRTPTPTVQEATAADRMVARRFERIAQPRPPHIASGRPTTAATGSTSTCTTGRRHTSTIDRGRTPHTTTTTPEPGTRPTPRSAPPPQVSLTDLVDVAEPGRRCRQKARGILDPRVFGRRGATPEDMRLLKAICKNQQRPAVPGHLGNRLPASSTLPREPWESEFRCPKRPSDIPWRARVVAKTSQSTETRERTPGACASAPAPRGRAGVGGSER